MATAIHGIVSGDESTVHEEPHVEGTRVTVRQLHGEVEGRGIDPETVADRYEIEVASVYEALAYYHRNPAEMRAAERRTERAGDIAAEKSDCTPPEE